jgi:phosphinothricin acetyltransferase
MAARIRPGVESDLADLTEIYNHYVRDTAITFDLEPFCVADRRSWFEGFGKDRRHRLLVADDAGRIVGYACSHRFRVKGAYDTSVETSVYLRSGCEGRGLGIALYDDLFRSLEGKDVHRAYAGITLPNAASVALHERFGFRLIGVFEEVGRKLGRYWDVAWYEARLGAGSARTQSSSTASNP